MRVKILKIYGITLACGIVYFLLVTAFDSGIPCFYKATTGFLCPGCGATDMTLALARLDVVAAFLHNPFVFTLFVVWTIVAIAYFIKNRMGKNDRLFLKILLIASLASAIAFAVARNIAV